jgi:hypothetical protein
MATTPVDYLAQNTSLEIKVVESFINLRAHGTLPDVDDEARARFRANPALRVYSNNFLKHTLANRAEIEVWIGRQRNARPSNSRRYEEFFSTWALNYQLFWTRASNGFPVRQCDVAAFFRTYQDIAQDLQSVRNGYCAVIEFIPRLQRYHFPATMSHISSMDKCYEDTANKWVNSKMDLSSSLVELHANLQRAVLDRMKMGFLDTVICTGIAPMWWPATELLHETAITTNGRSINLSDFQEEEYMKHLLVHDFMDLWSNKLLGQLPPQQTQRPQQSHNPNLVFTWPEWVKDEDEEARNYIFDDVLSPISVVSVLNIFNSITPSSVLISLKPWWPFRQVIADWAFDSGKWPAVIICEPYTPGSHVYPQDRTAYANMWDPPSPFFAQQFQEYYQAINLTEGTEAQHQFGKLVMYVRNDWVNSA